MYIKWVKPIKKTNGVARLFKTWILKFAGACFFFDFYRSHKIQKRFDIFILHQALNLYMFPSLWFRKPFVLKKMIGSSQNTPNPSTKLLRHRFASLLYQKIPRASTIFNKILIKHHNRVSWIILSLYSLGCLVITTENRVSNIEIWFTMSVFIGVGDKTLQNIPIVTTLSSQYYGFLFHIFLFVFLDSII